MIYTIYLLYMNILISGNLNNIGEYYKLIYLFINNVLIIILVYVINDRCTCIITIWIDNFINYAFITL